MSTTIRPGENTCAVYVEVTGEKLSIDAISQRVEDPGAGAIATFTGVTRNAFNGKEVFKLEYEAYKPMAEKKMKVRVHAHPYTCTH